MDTYQAIVTKRDTRSQTFKILDPRLKNPATEHRERAFRTFDLLV